MQSPAEYALHECSVKRLTYNDLANMWENSNNTIISEYLYSANQDIHETVKTE